MIPELSQNYVKMSISRTWELHEAFSSKAHKSKPSWHQQLSKHLPCIEKQDFENDAFIKRRGYVIPEDVRAIVFDVLRHRIGLTYEAEAENVTTEDLISQIINEVEVP